MHFNSLSDAVIVSCFLCPPLDMSSHQLQQQQPRQLWRAAPQPDIVRAAQKDDLYLQQSIDACHDAAMRTLGAIPALQHAKSCRLLATFMYYATTTAAGLQTLGEEYCDIMQLTTQPQHSGAAGLAPAHTRILLTLLQSLGPAVLGRLVASLDRASEEGRLQYELAGLEDFGSGFDSSSQQQQPDALGVSDSSSSAWQEEPHQQPHQHPDPQHAHPDARHSLQQLLRRAHASWQQVQQQLAPHWPVIRTWLLFAGRVHLAAFYLRGHYYEWAKRLAGVRYTSISPNKEQRASYKFLGYMLLVQLVISGVMQARSQLAAAQGSSSSEQGGMALQASQHKHAVLLPDPVEQPSVPEQPSAAAAAVADAEGASGSGGQQCPLCLSTRSHPTCTPCGHVFCWLCIAQWCLEKPECPLCRTAVVSSQLVCLYHSDM